MASILINQEKITGLIEVNSVIAFSIKSESKEGSNKTFSLGRFNGII